MTSSDAPSVPSWRVLRPDGELIRQESETEHPTRHLRDPGTLLALRRAGELLVIAPTGRAMVEWVTTVDRRVGEHGALRRCGPGISGDVVGPVRAWVSPSGPIVLTDGPVEHAIGALARLRAALEDDLWR
jgi:hypothetical protein